MVVLHILVFGHRSVPYSVLAESSITWPLCDYLYLRTTKAELPKLVSISVMIDFLQSLLTASCLGSCRSDGLGPPVD